MYSRETLFDAPVLTRRDFDQMVDAFCEKSGYQYASYGAEGVDMYPDYPLHVEYVMSSRLVYIMGLVSGKTPGLAILQGVVKIGGFKNDVLRAYELLKVTPIELDEQGRKDALKALRRRLAYAATLLAENAGLQRNDQYDEDVLCRLNTTRGIVGQS